ncbi:MAG: hypothetical protein QXX92_07285 [Candidatus Bathyarchaeia archaeon]
MNSILKEYLISLTIAFLIFCSCCPASFAKSSIALGSRNDVPDYEINADASIANMITSYSSIAGYSAYNWYGAQTTADNIYLAAFGNNHLYSISFYIGHGGSQYVWNWAGWIWYYEQQWFITDDNGGQVWDKDIFQHTSCGNCHFVLLWSCHQGETIGGTHWSGTPFGMPYAWLHTTSLSGNGYASPDNGGRAFIEWQDLAPFLTNDLIATDDSYYFLQYFYYAAIYRGYYYSIKAALDYAAQAVWGTNFGNCILYKGWGYGNMVVYGDGNMHISNYAGGGGGGCPLLYVYHGKEYCFEGLLDIHNPYGIDVIKNHTLITVPQPVNNAYLFRLVEHPLTHSYIDQVKLFAILEDGTIVKLPLISAVHDRYGNVLPQLLFSDDIKTDTRANEAITLKFKALRPTQTAIGFIFEIEGNNVIAKE